MKTTIHEKLVRDRIPEHIRREGHTPHTRVLTHDEYRAELLRKMHEEVNEYAESGDPEELADILEVFLALVGQSGSTAEDVEALRQKKSLRNGGFKDRIYLATVDRHTED